MVIVKGAGLNDLQAKNTILGREKSKTNIDITANAQQRFNRQ